MRTVVLTGPGELELCWSWLPTWIGLNARLKQEIEKDLSARIVGKSTLDLDEINELVLDYLCERFPIPGLRDYLDGLKFIPEDAVL